MAEVTSTPTRDLLYQPTYIEKKRSRWKDIGIGIGNEFEVEVERAVESITLQKIKDEGL